MKRLALSLLIALMAGLLSTGIALADNEVTSCTPNTCTIEAWTEETNHETYWETRFGMECTKHDSTDTPVHLDTGVAVLIIKAGQSNAIWQPAPAGDYSTDKTTSHWFTCGELPDEDRINPKGDIGGPCADPAYYGIFDNTDSDVTIRFRFRWYTNSGIHTVVKDVPAGAIYRTWEHWAKAGTLVRVGYRDPDTGAWKGLASLTAGKGMYPPCDYKHGWDYPSA